MNYIYLELVFAPIYLIRNFYINELVIIRSNSIITLYSLPKLVYFYYWGDLEMGLNFRKRIKIAPGVNLNVGKRGIGLSAGVRGASVSMSSRGVRANVGIPGSGLSYSHNLSSRKKRPQRVAYESIHCRQTTGVNSDTYKVVEEYNSHINMLTSVHLEAEEPVDWTSFIKEDVHGAEDGPNVLKAKESLSSYKPTWRDKLFNRVEARKLILNQKLQEAIELDLKLIEEKKELKDFAIRVINFEKEAWVAALNKYNPFEDIYKLGSKVEVNVNNRKELAVNLIIGNDQVVPKHVVSLTATNKVSNKLMAKGRYLQLYQDYVCSCVIRIAREVFSILPTDQVVINVYGYSQADEPPMKGCILSTIVNRLDLTNINFETIDCSDTVETFKHNMKFLKTKGFRLVEEL